MDDDAKKAAVGKAVSDFRQSRPFATEKEAGQEASTLFADAADRTVFLEAWKTAQVKFAEICDHVSAFQRRQPFATREEAAKEAFRLLADTADCDAFVERWRQTRSSVKRVAQSRSRSGMSDDMQRIWRDYD